MPKDDTHPQRCQHAKYERLIQAAKANAPLPTGGGPSLRRDFTRRCARGLSGQIDRSPARGRWRSRASRSSMHLIVRLRRQRLSRSCAPGVRKS